jgi:hypothetical protein
LTLTCLTTIDSGYNPDAGPEQYGKPDEWVRTKQIELKQHEREYSEKEHELRQLRETIRRDLLKERDKQNNSTGNSTDDSGSSIRLDQGAGGVSGLAVPGGALGASSNSAEHVYAGYKHSEEVSGGGVAGAVESPVKRPELRRGKLVSSIAYGENDVVQGVYSDHHKNRHR